VCTLHTHQRQFLSTNVPLLTQGVAWCAPACTTCYAWHDETHSLGSADDACVLLAPASWCLCACCSAFANMAYGTDVPPSNTHNAICDSYVRHMFWPHYGQLLQHTVLTPTSCMCPASGLLHSHPSGKLGIWQLRRLPLVITQRYNNNILREHSEQSPCRSPHERSTLVCAASGSERKTVKN
jgi:hypothetical protein